MEFIRGTKINDVAELKKQGFSLADIDQKLFKTFAEQIFHTGFVHADPHPGNVLVRRNKKGQAELVLLDHGLYETLPSPVRQSLCRLWKAIVLNNHPGMKIYSAELGVKDDYRLFCIAVAQRYISNPDKSERDIFSLFFGKRGPQFTSTSMKKLPKEERDQIRRELMALHDHYEQLAEILTQRPLNQSNFRLKTKLTEQDMKYMTEVARQRFDKIMEALRAMPRSLLLVIRNINTIRAIAKEHGDPTDRYTTMARSATQGAFVSVDSGFLQKLAGLQQRIYFEFKLWYDGAKFWLVRCCFSVLRAIGRAPDMSAILAGTH